MNQKGFAVVYLLIGVLILAALGGVYYFTKIKPDQINSFIKECEKVGGGILEIYPPSCQTPDGKIFGFGKKILVETNPSPALKAQEVDETVYTEGTRSANWNTYTNEKYKILFRYPRGWKQIPADWDGTTLDRDTGRMLETRFSSADNKLTLIVVTALSKEDLIYGHGLEGMKPIKESATKVGIFDAAIRVFETDTASPSYKTSEPISVFYGIGQIKEKPLMVEYSGEKSNTSLQELDQILSTFKFTQ